MSDTNVFSRYLFFSPNLMTDIIALRKKELICKSIYLPHVLIYHTFIYLTNKFSDSYNNIKGVQNIMAKKGNPLRQLPTELEKRGVIKLNLAEIMMEKNVSMNQLSFRTEMQRTQLRNYRDNKIQRLDIDILLRLCYVLDCDLHDLIIYEPPQMDD